MIRDYLKSDETELEFNIKSITTKSGLSGLHIKVVSTPLASYRVNI